MSGYILKGFDILIINMLVDMIFECMSSSQKMQCTAQYDIYYVAYRSFFRSVYWDLELFDPSIHRMGLYGTFWGYYMPLFSCEISREKETIIMFTFED